MAYQNKVVNVNMLCLAVKTLRKARLRVMFAIPFVWDARLAAFREAFATASKCSSPKTYDNDIAEHSLIVPVENEDCRSSDRDPDGQAFARAAQVFAGHDGCIPFDPLSVEKRRGEWDEDEDE